MCFVTESQGGVRGSRLLCVLETGEIKQPLVKRPLAEGLCRWGDGVRGPGRWKGRRGLCPRGGSGSELRPSGVSSLGPLPTSPAEGSVGQWGHQNALAPCSFLPTGL